MRLLVLGGSQFVGRAIVAEALARGWDVTVFNRGRSGLDLPGVEAVRGDRGSRADLERLAASGTWDAVVDSSGYVPRNVLEVARALRPSARRYVFVSTLSVYEGWPVRPLTEESPVLPCPPDADETFGTDTENGPTKYGYQKSGCEAAVLEVFGTASSMLLRAGVVLGPHEYVGRLPWWLERIARGGRVLAPGDPARSIQPIDARDIAGFAIDVVANGVEGAFNVTGSGEATFKDLLDACAKATGAAPDLVWTPDEVLLEHGVRQWSELPLWRTSPGTWDVGSAKARAAGLATRPLADTVRDTWEWMRDAELDGNERSAEIGIAPEKEQRILDR
ncbi:NAD-dependent epimerase/dehydratase family protein [Glycomyces terrestris]|uniref:NAD-dependent epimerase n=1 Tax=Glycomyces terrestris TaxID=2493553 RepID=A0A426V2Z7_9ACTN|nr:NAD-dependent epimerase/dehydratase family protein [Glycomyces terrestris]RRS01279.1 NAD-dependent epimerase [Glycomyces terrestris]